MSKRRRVSHPEIAWEDLSRSALRRNGFANETGTTRRGTKKQMENITERQNGIKKWYRQQKREKEKEWKRKRERFTVTLVLLCTCMHNHVHCPVYGATRYPLSPSALGCPWRPVLSQHPLPPSVTRSLQIRNLQHNRDDMSPPIDNFLSYVKKMQKIIFCLSRVYYDPHSTIKIRVTLKLEKLQDKCIETINFVELSPEN